MTLSSYNSNIIPPSYNDGFFEIFEIKSNSKVLYPDEFLVPWNKKIYFNEISTTDNIKILASDKKINISKKIRIAQNKLICSNFVLKIKNTYYSVFNTFHFTNKNGFPETDITLTLYDKEIKFEEDINVKG